MIVLGAVGVNPRRSPFMPLINDDRFIPNLKGLVDRIHSETGVKGCARRSMPPAYMPEAVNVYLAAGIRKTIRKAGHSIPVITAGRIPRPELAEEIIHEGQADIIALSRPLLRDTEWPLKAKEGRAKEINRCSYCSTCVDRIFNDKPALCQYLEG